MRDEYSGEEVVPGVKRDSERGPAGEQQTKQDEVADEPERDAACEPAGRDAGGEPSKRHEEKGDALGNTYAHMDSFSVLKQQSDRGGEREGGPSGTPEQGPRSWRKSCSG